ncbi:alpha-L-rhamnosidase N-terminal domain-containing protein [Pedobacter heparinus]|uniref:Alpha-L-rhamnosidase n=1 Tax=Pedobacter heparinus (strain ATCC 13125 / DSM 2366 / CIP 104194 / JCM 7457 / NBRC 12017 / NCIMB 9290 / NRRL B-14731 / HIM 762-3) TaxID=485917 RepID=C6Y2X3_PEDHD|nr:alpha-L-rhamnosidase N-terminal domain-containing protein [Pedobacter heparinus]ACU03186.1 alpha-L-rhamnosidase [Pedobacter heparinus DSM 2366]
MINQIFKFSFFALNLLAWYSFTAKSQDLKVFDKATSWITCDKAQDQSNSWIAFRKVVQLDEKPVKALLDISVDSKYWLYINEKLVVFEGGLKRGPNPDDTYYDEADLTEYLKAGTNTIAVLLWYFGKNGFSHHSSGRAGMFFQLDMDKQGKICSDRSWKCSVVPAYLNVYSGDQPNYRLAESNVIYDARLALGDWTSASYNDKTWRNPFVVGPAGCMPWNKLVKRPIPQWKDYGIVNFNLNFPFNATGDTIKVKLPYNAQFTPYLKVEATAGKTIEMFTDNYSGGSENNVRAEYITKTGIQEYESFGWMNGHVMMFVIPKGAKVLSLGYRETGYHTTFAGSFNCNDAFYNKLWEKSSRTLYVNMRDSYMDCPDRERAQWWGDEVTEMTQSFYALDPDANLLAKKGIDELTGWQRSDGVLFSPIPAGNFDLELPVQMLTSVGYYGFWTYYYYTGDLETIRAAYPSIRKYLSLWEMDKNGLVISRTGGWNWGDWGKNVDIDLMSNAWYYLACKGYLEMSKTLNHAEEIKWAENQMSVMKKSFDTRFWTGKAYRSPDYKGQTDDRSNALAVLAGLTAPAKYPLLKDVFLTEEHSSPYMEKYVLEALFKMGYADIALERLKKRYTAMVDSELTTLWEGWKIGVNGYGGGSYNHAWSGGGLILLSRFVAGIEPASPGYETVKIAPQMGSLINCSATVSSVAGLIAVKNTFTNEKEFNQLIESPSPLKIYFPFEVYRIKKIRVNNKKLSEALMLKFKNEGKLELSKGKYKLTVNIN